MWQRTWSSADSSDIQNILHESRCKQKGPSHDRHVPFPTVAPPQCWYPKEADKAPQGTALAVPWTIQASHHIKDRINQLGSLGVVTLRLARCRRDAMTCRTHGLVLRPMRIQNYVSRFQMFQTLKSPGKPQADRSDPMCLGREHPALHILCSFELYFSTTVWACSTTVCCGFMLTNLLSSGSQNHEFNGLSSLKGPSSGKQ